MCDISHILICRTICSLLRHWQVRECDNIATSTVYTAVDSLHISGHVTSEVSRMHQMRGALPARGKVQLLEIERALHMSQIGVTLCRRIEVDFKYD